MQKVILYYRFVPIRDPKAVLLWQKTLCELLNLRGRIIISQHGINGTLGGEMKDLKKYITANKNYPDFKKIIYKWSDGRRENFPKLSIKIRDEIVTFGAVDELRVDKNGIVGGGTRLKPGELHELIEEYGSDVSFFDGRNMHESSIGRFKGAITPKVRTTKNFIEEIEKPKYQALKEKPVVTYCTGGIRCEVLSLLMKNRGFKHVYQLDGGIVNYGKEYGDEGLWEGSLYVFDGRMAVKFSDKGVDIGVCTYCKKSTSRYINCANKSCNELILVCQNCDTKTYCKNEKINAEGSLVETGKLNSYIVTRK